MTTRDIDSVVRVPIIFVTYNASGILSLKRKGKCGRKLKKTKNSKNSNQKIKLIQEKTSKRLLSNLLPICSDVCDSKKRNLLLCPN